MIPFNKPYLHGRELVYIARSVESGKISGDGIFTKKTQELIEKKYLFPKTLLTTSCTAALEMAALLLDIQPGDEVIVPSFTFVSTANAFVLRGARIVFADSLTENPNINHYEIESLITNRTKAIVVVHYAGVACDMTEIQNIASKYNLHIVEDAAQAIDSYYYDKPLGGIGTFGTFSFHETKNIISGEGGLLAINNKEYFERAEIIREKGTNRSKFFRGQIDKYNWVDIGSSFLPSEIVSAYLYAQLEQLNDIQNKRITLWNIYNSRLSEFSDILDFNCPQIPFWSSNNAHMYYIVCKNQSQRTYLINKLKEVNIQAVFHYQALHMSPFFKNLYSGPVLSNSLKYSDCLMRLPMYYDLTHEECHYIADCVLKFLRNYRDEL